MQQFIDEFGAQSIRFVTADREFCSKDWLEFLIAKKISYRLRIKANYHITNARGQLIRASRLCHTLKIGERLELRGTRRLWEQTVFLEYGERWKIETLFGILKTRGFRLEDTHLTEIERIVKLLSLLTIAVSWAMMAGELEVQAQPLKTKKHGKKDSVRLLIK